MQQLINQVSWNEKGLVAAIAQDATTNEVLMMAWMNAEALTLTIKERRGIYFSRSRNALWRKGESSGHIQELVDIRLDCDGDTLLLKVNQLGGIACHTGRKSCFYLQPEEGQWQAVEPIIKKPEDIYEKK